MTLHRLADLDDWKLEDGGQDIRERPLLAPSGAQVGIIKDFMVDLDEERVAAVVTDMGESYATESLEIRPEAVVAHDGPISGGTSPGASARPAGATAYQGRITRPH